MSTDCEHTVTYYAVDIAGNPEDPHTITFRIDKTPPTIDLTWEAKICQQALVTADVTDVCSGVDYVEFYKDDSSTPETVSEPPWEWLITVACPSCTHDVDAIVYDYAGNSATDSVSDIVGGPGDPVELIDDLIDYIDGLDYISDSHKESLINHLENAEEKLLDENIAAARGNLNAFINQVNTPGFGLTDEDQLALTTIANLIIAILNNCY